MMQTTFTVDARQLAELAKQEPPRCVSTGHTLAHTTGLVITRLQHPDATGTVIEKESLVGICGKCGQFSWWREKDYEEATAQ